MARAWRHHQQVSREELEPGTSEPNLGAWYGKSVAYTLYILLVCIPSILILLRLPD